MATEGTETRLIAHVAKPSKGARRWCLLAALVAGEGCSIYATFFAHALTPASVYLVDRYTHRRLMPGHIGDIEEIFNLDGLILVLVLSFVAFALAWCIMRVTANGWSTTGFGVRRLESLVRVNHGYPHPAGIGSQSLTMKSLRTAQAWQPERKFN